MHRSELVTVLFVVLGRNPETTLAVLNRVSRTCSRGLMNRANISRMMTVVIRPASIELNLILMRDYMISVIIDNVTACRTRGLVRNAGLFRVVRAMVLLSIAFNILVNVMMRVNGSIVRSPVVKISASCGLVSRAGATAWRWNLAAIIRVLSMVGNTQFSVMVNAQIDDVADRGLRMNELDFGVIFVLLVVCWSMVNEVVTTLVTIITQVNTIEVPTY